MVIDSSLGNFFIVLQLFLLDRIRSFSNVSITSKIASRGFADTPKIVDPLEERSSSRPKPRVLVAANQFVDEESRSFRGSTMISTRWGNRFDD